MVLVLFSRGGVGLYQACIPWLVCPDLSRLLLTCSRSPFSTVISLGFLPLRSWTTSITLKQRYRNSVLEYILWHNTSPCFIMFTHSVYIFSSTASQVLLSFSENCFQSQTNKTSYYVEILTVQIIFKHLPYRALCSL